MKELAIGEELRIRCVEDKDKSCSRCYFKDSQMCDWIKCDGIERTDGKGVHFELVEESYV